MERISTKKVLPSSSFSHPSVSSSSSSNRQKLSSKMTLNKTALAVFIFAILGAQVEGSFVTKINNGFERLVVSIDDQLALPLTSPQSSTTASSSSYKGATQECQFILEQLKVSSTLFFIMTFHLDWVLCSHLSRWDSSFLDQEHTSTPCLSSDMQCNLLHSTFTWIHKFQNCFVAKDSLAFTYHCKWTVLIAYNDND